MTIAAWTFHGGRIAAARAAYGDAQPWLDLSTGINPHVWPGVADVAIDWRALPDEEALAGLEHAAADHFGVDAAHVCAVPGTELGLRLIGEQIGGLAVHVGPGYGTHAAMIPGSTQIAAADLHDAIDASIIVANPNNPDGKTIERALLDAHLVRFSGTPHWLIVDEAYAETLPEISIADQVHDRRALVVLRSFGKFYGLAGVRLGFAIGPRALIAAMRARLGSWPVSAAAVAIGTRAYRDDSWAAAMRRRLEAEAVAVDALLLRHDLVATGECPLFRLIDCADAAAVFERLARRAILTRPFAYNPRWLRIGLPGSAEAMMRLDCALCDG